MTGRNEQTGEETVEMVHEALIREWRTLHKWINDNRQFRTWQERLKVAMSEWKTNNYDSGALLRGLPLAIAQEWQQKRLDELTKEERGFIQASIEFWNREKEEKEHNQTLIERNKILTKAQRRAQQLIRIGSTILGLSIVGAIIAGIFADNGIKQAKEAQESTKLEQQGVAALRQFEYQELEALLVAMDAGQKLKELVKDGRPLEKYPAASPILALQTILDNIHERNKLFENKNQSNGRTAYVSPDGKQILTINIYSNTAKLWDTSGRLIAELKGHEKVGAASFCGDKHIMTESGEYVKLWDKAGNILTNIKEYQGKIQQAECFPDGKIVTLSQDGTANIWLYGRPIANLKVKQEKIIKVVISQDEFDIFNKVITISNGDNVRVWNLSGKQLAYLKGNQDKIRESTFIPGRNNLIATISYSGKVKVWDLNSKSKLKLINEFQAQDSDQIIGLPSRDIATRINRAYRHAFDIWDVHTGQRRCTGRA